MAGSRLPSNNEDYALASKMQLLVLTVVPYYGFLQCAFMSGAWVFDLSQVWAEKRTQRPLIFDMEGKDSTCYAVSMKPSPIPLLREL